MKKVRSGGKIRLKTAKSVTRSTAPQISRVVRKTENVDWAKGKSKGTGLGDYNLDLMILE